MIFTNNKLIEIIESLNSKVKKQTQITISKNNRKMNDISSFSVYPVLTCPNCEQCCKDCYAVKICKLYKNVDFSYLKNTYLLLKHKNLVYLQLLSHCKMVSVFRFNVAGDIFNYDYLKIIHKIAVNCPNCKILVFTKSYKLVSDFYQKRKKPNNLQIIFSKWKNDIYNPLCFPTSDIFNKNDFLQMTKNDFLCGGNCSECFMNCSGCFALKSGENVYFKKH